MNTARLLRLAAFLMASFSAWGVHASDVQAMLEWKSECVGRMQIKLPGDVELAALMPAGFQQEIKSAASAPAYVFQDGTKASLTSFYYGGVLFITHELDHSRQMAFRKSAISWQHEMSDIVNKERKKNTDGTPMVFENLQTEQSGPLGWRVDESYIAYLDVGKSSVLWKMTGRPDIVQRIRHDYQSLKAAAVARETFSVPASSGVCLPYIFLNDDGQTHHTIAMSYRLKAHPDVTIWLEDASAAGFQDQEREQRLSPAYRIADFWGQYIHVDEKSTSLWNLPRMRSIAMNGKKGLASFVKITRSDKSEDFGYFAVVRGVAGSTQESPDLRLLVVRNAAKAHAKNILPIDEKMFLQIAERVTASVKYRSTR